MVSCPDPSDEHEQQKYLGSLFRKYVRVWIWSIIFGLNTALTLSFSTQNFLGRYNIQISSIIAIPTILAALTVIISWSFLSIYLRRSLIPLLWLSQADESLDNNPQELRYLSVAMQFAIYAVVFRAVGVLVEAVFGSLGKYF
jgi:hypothetical protein